AAARAAASWNEATSRSLRDASARIAKLAEARERYRAALSREINADAARRFREFSTHHRDALRALLRAGEFEQRRTAARHAREQWLRLLTEWGVNRERLRAVHDSSKAEAAGIVRPQRAASQLLTKVSLEAVPQPIRDHVMSGSFKFTTTTSDGLTIYSPP